MGFCFFNNVAVAAKYALQRYNLQRVAVVDFDVHHGNGTEDILAGDPRALMVGIFQHPFYPYSGDQNPAANMVNVPVAAYTRGMDIREIIEMMWIPRLEAFKPEMISSARASTGTARTTWGSSAWSRRTLPGSPTGSWTSRGAIPRAASCRAWKAAT